MHPTLHKRAPQASAFHEHGVEITRDDVIDAIAQIAASQSTRFVSIYKLAIVLGLIEEDIAWTQQAIGELDEQHRVMLCCIEYPQKLPSFMAPWFVRNASGIPCHEICVAPDSHRIKPLLRQHAPTTPGCRISEVLQSTVDALFGMGTRPHTQIRVLPVTSTKEAA